ncbi:MAG: hypothetical protein A3E84_04520 [Gammaproteobacteria bacterium RIFCSPHIGHO2_12_FULL_42_13]|nr:MAG: hypothetical protein A3E84_04520 [Gammaproteobacteria bacterium RIFCSPHIGHO2_12_FULL_42_13]
MLWSCEAHGQGNNTVLRVMVDGATLGDCERLSRDISALLAVEDPFRTAYHLEVSSPGIHRKLSTLSHFSQSVGKKIKIKWRAASGEYFTEMMTIMKVSDNDQIFLQAETGDTVIVSIAEINKASIV